MVFDTVLNVRSANMWIKMRFVVGKPPVAFLLALTATYAKIESKNGKFEFLISFVPSR